MATLTDAVSASRSVPDLDDRRAGVRHGRRMVAQAGAVGICAPALGCGRPAVTGCTSTSWADGCPTMSCSWSWPSWRRTCAPSMTTPAKKGTAADHGVGGERRIRHLDADSTRLYLDGCRTMEQAWSVCVRTVLPQVGAWGLNSPPRVGRRTGSVSAGSPPRGS